jgi:hypothetical protein
LTGPPGWRPAQEKATRAQMWLISLSLRADEWAGYNDVSDTAFACARTLDRKRERLSAHLKSNVRANEGLMGFRLEYQPERGK